MDNASDALIIAGTILIALIILTLGVYLVASYSKVNESYNNKITMEEIQKLNSKFIAFENREDITAQEIVTLQKFVNQYNKENGTNIKITPTIINDDDTSLQREKKGVSFILNSLKSSKVIYYKCPSTNIVFDSQGIISSIKFDKK